jgi:threonine/homoserine/homoserine lactone efflux protein
MLNLIPVHEVQHFGILVRLQAGASRMFAQRRFTGSFFLGVLFALSFCPVGIVFYFGMLIPLAYRMGDPVVIPSVFAIATALPTIGISLIITMGLFSLGSMLPILQKANVWMQRIVGIVFLLVGIYYLPRLFEF